MDGSDKVAAAILTAALVNAHGSGSVSELYKQGDAKGQAKLTETYLNMLRVVIQGQPPK